jgi:hypothetical protein
MTLYRIGKTVLNIDRINGIIDHHAPADPHAPEGGTVLRVLFDEAHIDLTGKEAEAFRYWFRHASRSLDPHWDEDGEELISPDDQVRRAYEVLCGLIDRDQSRDRVMRHTAHRLRHIIERFLTGELHPARSKDFERNFEVTHLEPSPVPAPDHAQS